MASLNVTPRPENLRQEPVANATRNQIWPLLAIAAALASLHLITNSRYGIHRDELQFLSDARHLDWGFVSYPPFTPLVERISLSIFGMQLLGLRLFQWSRRPR
jgi:hypothetical protein